jgi:hypothetical protein
MITVSQANWTDQMIHFWSATSSLVNIYFVTLILLGSYFALNLVLVRFDGHCIAIAVPWPQRGA